MLLYDFEIYMHIELVSKDVNIKHDERKSDGRLLYKLIAGRIRGTIKTLLNMILKRTNSKY